MTQITYGGVTDLYYYTYEGLRYRARLNGTYYRYLYDGERVLEELNDSGTMTARYTMENGSYYGQWLHLYRPSGSMSRFPMYDNIGTARGLLDASGTATDWYELDTFGRQVSSSGTTPNPYRYGGAWGYITDPSGMLQLGERFYYPELGRLVSQDPIREGGIGMGMQGTTPPRPLIRQVYPASAEEEGVAEVGGVAVLAPSLVPPSSRSASKFAGTTTAMLSRALPGVDGFLREGRRRLLQLPASQGVSGKNLVQLVLPRLAWF